MNKAYFEQDINNRMDEIENKDDLLCVGLNTLASYASSARSTMLTQHLVQAEVPDHPEIPAVSTGYEKLFGKYSVSYKQTDSKLKVIDKIVKFENFVYTLIVYNQKEKMYDIVQRNEVRNLDESYGYKINNEEIDSYKVNDTISKGTVLYKSPCMDEYGNFMYGINAKIAYVISQDTIEDAVVMSESFAKKFSVTKVKNCMVPINDNDVLLNLYGDKNKYKAFPEIGESTKKCIICGTRRKNKSYDILNLKNSNLRKTIPGDDIYQFYGNYKVVDINIWSNKTIDDIPDLPAYDQLRVYFTKITNYYKDIYDKLDKIINSDEKYSTELSRLYAKARDFLDPECKYLEEDKMFSNILMEFVVAKSEPFHVGCKISGRYGNKSVISQILPDEEMGITEDGTPIDIKMDALGVLGRLNSGQCIEQELNWMANQCRKEMSEIKGIDNQIEHLLYFIKGVSEEEYENLKVYISELDIDEKAQFVKDVLDDKIYIMQKPFDSITGDQLYELYKKMNPKKSAVYYTDSKGVTRKAMRPLIVADEYILRLKQEPITKFSARSKSLINPRTFMPIKSMKAKKNKSIYPDQCNRIGEQELAILLLTNDTETLDYFYRSQSSSIAGRRSTSLFEDDYMEGHESDIPDERSRIVDILNAYMKTKGYKLQIEFDDESDKIEKSANEPVKIPRYIKELF